MFCATCPTPMGYALLILEQVANYPYLIAFQEQVLDFSGHQGALRPTE